MSDIDVDALITEAMNHVAQINLYEWENGDVQEVVRWVAALVEQDVSDRIERAMFSDTDGGWVSDDSELPVGELRRLLSLARGGSDVG